MALRARRNGFRAEGMEAPAAVSGFGRYAGFRRGAGWEAGPCAMPGPGSDCKSDPAGRNVTFRIPTIPTLEDELLVDLRTRFVLRLR
jgi:hypothetical protein